MGCVTRQLARILQRPHHHQSDRVGERVVVPFGQREALEWRELSAAKTDLRLHRLPWSFIEGSANLPQPASLGPPRCPLEHLLVKKLQPLRDTLRPRIGKRRVHMTNPLLNRSVIADPVELGVFALEPPVIIKPPPELFGQADYVPIVRDLLQPVLVEAKRPSAQLVNAHAGGHGRQVDEHVDTAGIPAFPEEPPRTNETPGDALLERFGDHLGIMPRPPVLAAALDFVVAVSFHGSQVDLEVEIADPALKIWQDPRQKIVVHQHRRAGHKHRVQSISLRVGQQRSERGDCSAGLFVQDSLNQGCSRGLLKIGDENGSQPVTQRAMLGLENHLHRLELGRGIGHHPANRGGARPHAGLSDLGAHHPQPADRLLSESLVSRTGRPPETMSNISIKERDEPFPLRPVGYKKPGAGKRNACRQASPCLLKVHPCRIGEDLVPAPEARPVLRLSARQPELAKHILQPAVEPGDPRRLSLRRRWRVVPELRDQSLEVFIDPGDIPHLLHRWSHKISKVLVRSEVAISNQRRHRYLVVNRPEEGTVSLGVIRISILEIGRRSGQPENHWIIKQPPHLAQNPSPVTQEMVALIKHNEPDAGIDKAIEVFARARGQRAQHLSAANVGVTHLLAIRAEALVMIACVARPEAGDPGVGARWILRLALSDKRLYPQGPGPRLEVFIAAARQSDGLVSERCENARVLWIRNHRLLVSIQVKKLLRPGSPLGLDRRVRAENESRPFHEVRPDVEPENRLARAGRSDNVKLPLTLLQLFTDNPHGGLLRGPQGTVKSYVAEAFGHDRSSGFWGKTPVMSRIRNLCGHRMLHRG